MAVFNFKIRFRHEWVLTGHTKTKDKLTRRHATARR